jgi:hypothetical protein
MWQFNIIIIIIIIIIILLLLVLQRALIKGITL